MNYISETQQEIVNSSNRYKLINGCAGSHKTDTLVKCAIVDLELNRRPILYITLIGSVTIEIKERLETVLKINLVKKGNNYIGSYDKIPICISNFDSWVHLMLGDDANLIGDQFNKKTEMLLAKSSNMKLDCIMCNTFKTSPILQNDGSYHFGTVQNYKAGLLILDEAQDLYSDQMDILVNVAKSSYNMSFYIAGDYLQSVMYEQNKMDIMSMNIFKKLSPVYFDLKICMRCPKAHVDFNNLILRDIQEKYGIPEMLSCNDDTVNKPLLFTHLGMTNNADARLNALNITKMIEIAMEHDNTIVPDDIAIIMAKVNDNTCFEHLVVLLSELYLRTRNISNSVCLMSTKADGYHSTLDWKKAEGKTKLLSIHGDKGKGHKVVFFLGLTEGSIPKEFHIFKPSEIIGQSLFNVGTTRSTKYLFIGFSNKFPSRYLKKKSESFANTAYLAWEANNIVAEPYKSIAAKLYVKPYWESKHYKEGPVLSGSKSELNVKNDISKDFDHPNDLILHSWKETERTIHFGKQQNFKVPFTEGHFTISGLMSELLIQRIVDKDNLFSLLQKYSDEKNVIYTCDETLLCFMYDLRDIQPELKKNYLEDYDDYFRSNRILEQIVRDSISSRKMVIHSIFNSTVFIKDLHEFLSDVDNRELSTSCIWNVTLFHNQIKQKMYQPVVHTYMGFLNEEITVLHDNIKMYTNNYLKNKKLKIEFPLIIRGIFTNAELKILNNQTKEENKEEKKKKIPKEISIKGRCDLYIEDSNCLVEIKTSNFPDCSQEWIIQTICYVLLLDLYDYKTEKFSIVNILAGCMYEWDVPKEILLENIITNQLTEKYQWHSIETNKLLESVSEMRSELE